MTKDEKKEFLELIKLGTLQTLTSSEARNLIKEGTLEALTSEGGKEAIVNALGSDSGEEAIVGALASIGGQKAIKKAALEAFKSKEGEEVFADYFRDAFPEVVAPILDQHDKAISELQTGHMSH